MPPKKGPSSRGVGITSGLTQPVQNFSLGGYAKKYEEYYEEFLPLAQKIAPQESYLDRNAPALLNFFAALGTPTAPGQTVLGKIGEAGAQLGALKPRGREAEKIASSLALEFATKEEDDPDISIQRVEDKDTGEVDIIGIDKQTGDEVWKKTENITPEIDKPDEDYERAKDNVISEWAAYRKTQGREDLPEDLTESQIKRIIANIGEDGWQKTLREGDTLNEFYEYTEKFLIPELETILAAEAAGGTTVVNEDLEAVPIPEGFSPIIVSKYNLDPNSYNFEQDYTNALEKYNKLPEINEDQATSFFKAVGNLKTLNSIVKNADEAIPLIGEPAAYVSKLFGFDVGLAELAVDIDRLDLNAVDLLIKGVPSNIDLAKTEAITPNEGEAPSIVRLKSQKLADYFGQILIDVISYNASLDKKIPQDIIMQAREIVGNDLVERALGNSFSEQQKSDLLTLTRKEYIDKYGDPLEKSMNILNTGVPKIESDLSDEELDKQLDEQLRSLGLIN
jgi:hypothetical protein